MEVRPSLRFSTSSGTRHCLAGGVNWIDITPAEDLELDRAAVAEASAAGRCRPYEKHYVRPDGTSVPVQVGYVLLEPDRQKSVAFILDVSERKRAEAALKESEALYRLLFTSSPSGVVLLEDDGRISAFNDRACGQLGYTREEFAQLDLGDIETDDPEPMELRRQLAAIASAGGQELELSHRTRSGEIRKVSIVSHQVEVGKQRRVLSVWNDVTERRRVEEAVRESEERFRVMADGAPIILWVSDERSESQFVNRGYCDYFGVDREQATGAMWRSFLHPEDASGYVETFLASMREQRPFGCDVRVKRNDGEWRRMESYAQPRFSPAGEFLGHVGISQDVTDRRAAVAALEEQAALLHLARDAILVRGAADEITFWSRGAEQTYGFRRDEALGTTPQHLLKTSSPVGFEVSSRSTGTSRRNGGARRSSSRRRGWRASVALRAASLTTSTTSSP